VCWLSNRLPAVVAWLFNDVPARRGLAAAWLKRGASARGFWNQACPPRFSPGIREEEPFMAGVMIGVDPHKASHTAVAINVLLGEANFWVPVTIAERILAIEVPPNR
jgi:hypothetical protein